MFGNLKRNLIMKLIGDVVKSLDEEDFKNMADYVLDWIEKTAIIKEKPMVVKICGVARGILDIPDDDVDQLNPV